MSGAIALIVGVSLAAFAWHTWKDTGADDAFPAAFLAVLCFAWALFVNHSSSDVTAYCSYGAVSQAQLDGCVDHVSASTIDERDTNAAKFSRGEIEGCYRYDAGPFCFEAEK